MNNQNDYLVVKAHIDDLLRAAERARMARDIHPSGPTRAGRGLVGRLRRLIDRCPDLTTPELHAGCP